LAVGIAQRDARYGKQTSAEQFANLQVIRADVGHPEGITPPQPRDRRAGTRAARLRRGEVGVRRASPRPGFCRICCPFQCRQLMAW
jgi:hypothetical protein